MPRALFFPSYSCGDDGVVCDEGFEVVHPVSVSTGLVPFLRLELLFGVLAGLLGFDGFAILGRVAFGFGAGLEAFHGSSA